MRADSSAPPPNSAGTAALAASAEELARQAEALQEAVKQFAVSNGQDH